jgi:hypothetical protein
MGEGMTRIVATDRKGTWVPTCSCGRPTRPSRRSERSYASRRPAARSSGGPQYRHERETHRDDLGPRAPDGTPMAAFVLPTMKVVCAWCVREGKPGDLGEREPLEDPGVTHSICAGHRDQLLEDLPSRSFPDVAVLIVVRPNDTALFEHLQGC